MEMGVRNLMGSDAWETPKYSLSSIGGVILVGICWGSSSLVLTTSFFGELSSWYLSSVNVSWSLNESIDGHHKLNQTSIFSAVCHQQKQNLIKILMCNKTLFHFLCVSRCGYIEGWWDFLSLTHNTHTHTQTHVSAYKSNRFNFFRAFFTSASAAAWFSLKLNALLFVFCFFNPN